MTCSTWWKGIFFPESARRPDEEQALEKLSIRGQMLSRFERLEDITPSKEEHADGNATQRRQGQKGSGL